MKQTAKITVRGKHRGKSTIIEVIEYNGGKDENGDWKNSGALEIIKDGVSLINAGKFSDELIKSPKLCDYIFGLESVIRKRCLKNQGHHVYNPSPTSIEAYWLAFNYGDGFDEVPKITIEGEIQTLGSPFSDEHTTYALF